MTMLLLVPKRRRQGSLSSYTVVANTTRRHYTTAVDLDFDLRNHIVPITYAVNVVTFAKDATVAVNNAPADQTKLAIRGDAKQAANHPV